MRDGEKPSRYFCNLMKNNILQKYIPKLIDDDGVATKSQTEVEERIRNFCKDLYSNKDDELDNKMIEEFFEGDLTSHPKLSRKQQMDIDQEVTMGDLERAIKKTKIQSSPGSTGLTF